MLHNVPIWIPIHVFKKCNTIFYSLIWRKQVPCIKLETLQEKKDSGGLAAPNPFYYVIAAQLQHLRGWLHPESSDPIQNIIRIQLSSDCLMECIETGELGLSPSYPTLTLIDRVWNKTKQHFLYSGYTNWSRIWNNRNYPELGKLQGFSAWSRSGVVFISQLYHGGLLRELHSLHMEFNLPNTFFFQYLQLRHALSPQSTISTWELTMPTILTQLVTSSSRKEHISSLFGSLIGHISICR